MKKSNLKLLKFDKKIVSNLNAQKIKGGDRTFNCTARTVRGCW